jgi:hypothetical protein
LKEIVARAQEDLETVSKEDKQLLLKVLQEHRTRQASGYRVVSKAQQQDVVRISKRFEQEVTLSLLISQSAPINTLFCLDD